MIHTLRSLFPHATIALRFRSRWQLVVAVILSAQNTDKKVNEVTQSLFARFATVDDFARLDSHTLAHEIGSINYYKNKARHIVSAARFLQEHYGGRVPHTVGKLTALPGVGRKSALVIQGVAYNVSPEGIAVDTHVMRLSQKYNLTDHTTPEKIEKDLMEITPQTYWTEISYLLIDFGRTYCPARVHDCTAHPLTDIYPPAASRWPR